MLSMGILYSKLYECCFGGGSGQVNLPPLLSDDRRVTVRRISSVGVTVLDENGEENELPRHSSIIQSYNGVSVPWRSTPLSVQPGVTREEVDSRIKALPTITEAPHTKSKPKAWKKMLSGPKSESRIDQNVRDIKSKGEIDTQYKKVSSSADVTLSQDDIVNKRAKINDPEWRPLRRPSYSSSPNLFAIKTADKSSEHMMSITEYSTQASNSEEKRSSWLQAQSLETLSIDDESEASKLAKQYGLDLSLYIQNDDSPLGESRCEVELLKFWPDRPYGTVDVVVSLNPLQKLLTVTIEGMRDLSGMGPQRQTYPVIFRLALLGDKKNVKTGRKLAGTSKLKVNQTFSFFTKDVNSRGFRVSVYHAEFMGRHDAIGHALFNITNATRDPRAYPLKLERSTTLDTCHTILEIAFHLSDTLNVTVFRASKILRKHWGSRFYVKQSYFSLSKKSKERVSAVCWKEGHSDVICFDHVANFKIDSSGQKHSYVVISLKACDSGKLTFRKNDKTIGRVILGPCFYYEDGSLTPWGKVLLRKEHFSGSIQMAL